VYRIHGYGSRSSLMAEQRRRVADFKKFVLAVKKADALANEVERRLSSQRPSHMRQEPESGLEETCPSGRRRRRSDQWSDGLNST